MPERFDNDRVVVYRDLVPEDIFSDVTQIVQAQTSRKRVYPLRYRNTPTPLLDLAQFIGGRLSVAPTVAIGKRYEEDERYRSRAYDFHIDPPEWSRHDLITLSLGGTATLTAIDTNDSPFVIKVCPNTLVRMSPDVLHCVSPPQTDEPRHVVFLGNSQGY